MLSRGLLATAALFPALCAPGPTILVVNSTDDESGGLCDASHCNLREAIQAANALPGTVEIHFGLALPPDPIRVESPLPPLRGNVILDGATQEGVACPTPVVQIDGSLLGTDEPGNGLEVFGNRNEVRGLSITGFPGHGVVVKGNENLLECLFVGLAPNGTAVGGEPAALLADADLGGGGNGGHGIAVIDGHSNHIGGAEPEYGNLLSDNGGQALYSEDALNTVFHHNSVGLDLAGNPRLPNANAELPRIIPPPEPSPLGPERAARLTAFLELLISDVMLENQQALEDAGLFEAYLPLVEPDPRGGPPPEDLSQLIAALAEQPELYGQFTQEAADVLAEEQSATAAYLSVLGDLFRAALPGFGRTTAPTPADRRDLQGEILSRFDPDDFVVSGAPSEIVAVEEGGLININPIRWHSLFTYGPTTINTSLGSIQSIRTCIGTSTLCYWPTAYELLPYTVELLWESSTLTQQQMEDIVQENGYYLKLKVNNQLLYKGPPFGTPNVDPQVLFFQGYSAATVPGAPCPSGRICLSTAILGRRKLASIPRPWTFDLEVEKLTQLDMPVLKGIDQYGNPIWATHKSEPFAHASRVVLPNQETGDEKWFTAGLLPTFHHPRCTDCHGFENFDGLAQHHMPQDKQYFIGTTNLHLEPSLYVSGAHVMACSNCHWLPLTDPNGHPFHETQWLVPYQDLDVNWANKNATQICARVKANLPTRQLRHQHFHGDARLFWAIEDPFVPGKQLAAAPPSYERFLSRIDVWDQFGSPCP